MAATQFAPMGVTPNMLKSELDMDTFFDFNQGTSLNSPLETKAHARAGPSRPAPTTYQESFDDIDEKQVFAGPSHEYDRFKQQTGVHIGDLSHLNQPMPCSFNQVYGGFNTGIDETSMGGWSTGLDMDSDMNMDFASSMPAIYNPAVERSRSQQSNDFIDPNSIDGVEEPPSNVGRLWPGMHQQQAMAKAQAQGQVPEHKGKGRATSHQSDPHTEESISRLLNQMRHGSTVSTIHEEDGSVQDGFMPNIARLKKDDDDLDEDERLLASDEGKKLSSKERRQLRNKVSARAFRSRRKEYISQLEGEVAVKNQECLQLKSDNSKLSEENARYKDLIQYLLRQPSFAPVLQDISKEPGLVGLAGQQQQQRSHTPTPTIRSQQPANQQHRQNVQHGGMSRMPEAPVDLSMLNLSNGGFAMPQGMNFNFQ